MNKAKLCFLSLMEVLQIFFPKGKEGLDLEDGWFLNKIIEYEDDENPKVPFMKARGRIYFLIPFSGTPEHAEKLYFSAMEEYMESLTLNTSEDKLEDLFREMVSQMMNIMSVIESLRREPPPTEKDKQMQDVLYFPPFLVEDNGNGLPWRNFSTGGHSWQRKGEEEGLDFLSKISPHLIAKTVDLVEDGRYLALRTKEHDGGHFMIHYSKIKKVLWEEEKKPSAIEALHEACLWGGFI